MKHTSTPWELDGNGHIYGGLTKGCGIRTATPYSEANAAFIVKCVNNHYQLLDALKELVNAPPLIDDGTDMTKTIQAKINASVAIKQAEDE